jgi:hypothetical protein
MTSAQGGKIMKARHGSRKQVLVGLMVSGCVATLALQPLAAHAGLTPSISASVETGGAIVHVSGFGFGPGDRVKVVESVGGQVVGKVMTTATQFIVKPPPCTTSKPCYYYVLVGGGINVSLPPHYVHCGYQQAAVRAYDMTEHTRSNVARVTLGLGPC